MQSFLHLTRALCEKLRLFQAGMDLQKYTDGASKEDINLHSQTIQAIASEYATRRKQFRQARLAWRKSRGARRSLGKVPFKKSGITYAHGQIRYGKGWRRHFFGRFEGPLV
ncbi:MAG: hypothetical protein EOP02_01430 [Proteobacteria bacterium]|nr:MAG: hypothetical protein EOP02_01430 [Pseudomonadota bacterium]